MKWSLNDIAIRRSFCDHFFVNEITAMLSGVLHSLTAIEANHDEVYHIGASLKDLGKKWFAFSLMHCQKTFLLSNIF